MSVVLGRVTFMRHDHAAAKHARRAGAHRAGPSWSTKVATAAVLTAALGLGGVVASTSSFADSGDPTPVVTSTPTPSESQTSTPTASPTSSSTVTPSSTASPKPSTITSKKPVKKAKKKLPALKLPKVTKGKTLGKSKAHSFSATRASRSGRPGSKAYNFMYARTYVYLKYGWGQQQYVCLRKLWAKESNWRTMAHNRRSGAYGIPQAMPGRKMANEGRDWKTNAATQIRWGAKYVKSTYGTPCHALYTRSMRGWY